jgi:Collagen triple helix repeat (20 copies)
MAISQAQYIDLLVKKLFGVAKTDTNPPKAPSNESIASPPLLSGDIVWTESDQIPATAQTVSGITQSYLGGSSVQCTADPTVGLISGVNPTWLTGLTDWIPSEFGSTWLVKVYAGPPGAANIQSTGTQLFAAGSGGTGEYFFDNQAGLLNFIGNTIPASLTVGNVIYVAGYRYVGLKGVTNLPGNTAIGNLTINGNTITSTLANGNITLATNGTGVVNVTGNVAANYYFGNGSQLTGINASSNKIFNGNSYANIASTNGNLVISINGSEWTFGTDGVLTAPGNISATGNVTGDYYFGNGYYLTGIIPPTSIINQTVEGNNVANTFTLLQSATANTVLVTINGITQTPDTDYAVTGNTITFSTAPYNGDVVQIRFLAVAGPGGGSGVQGATGSQGTTGAQGTTGIQGISGSNGTQGTTGIQGISGSNGTQGTTGIQGISGSNGTQGTTGIQGISGSNGTQGTTGSFNGNLSANINGQGYSISNVAIVSATGNITGNYILGNGSQLTGIAASYGNSNVSTFLAAYGSNTISTSGNITAGNLIGNINVTGNVIGTSSNVQLVAGSYTWTFDNTGNLTIPATGDILLSNSQSMISAAGNITGNYIFGNIAFANGVPASYGNSNVSALLAAFGSNTIGTTGNITAGNFVGNGAALSNITVSIAGNVVGSQANVGIVAGSYTWTFDNTGNITLPTGGDLVFSANTTLTSISNGNITIDPNGTGQLLVTATTPVQFGNTLSVAGNVTVSGTGGVKIPNLPAFRVYGNGTTGGLNVTTNGNGVLNANNWAVDYNQGGYLNSSTGVFTAPIAGLYQVNLVARCANNTGPASQVVVIKNFGSGNVNQAFWEIPANAGVNHFGVSTVSKLGVGDTLVVKVTQGNISFDVNDNWSVAFLG